MKIINFNKKVCSILKKHSNIYLSRESQKNYIIAINFDLIERLDAVIDQACSWEGGGSYITLNKKPTFCYPLNVPFTTVLNNWIISLFLQLEQCLILIIASLFVKANARKSLYVEKPQSKMMNLNMNIFFILDKKF